MSAYYVRGYIVNVKDSEIQETDTILAFMFLITKIDIFKITSKYIYNYIITNTNADKFLKDLGRILSKRLTTEASLDRDFRISFSESVKLKLQPEGWVGVKQKFGSGVGNGLPGKVLRWERAWQHSRNWESQCGCREMNNWQRWFKMRMDMWEPARSYRSLYTIERSLSFILSTMGSHFREF